MQSRWKSKLMWSSIIAQVCAILVMLGVFDNAMSEQVQAVLGGVLQLMAIIGIINNPTNGTQW